MLRRISHLLQRLRCLRGWTCVSLCLAGLLALLSIAGPVEAAGSTPTPTSPPATPEPTGWPHSVIGDLPPVPTSPPDDALACGEGLPDGWGTVTPSPSWWYYCSRCVDAAFRPFATPVPGGTPTPTPTPPSLDYSIVDYSVQYGIPYYTELISESVACELVSGVILHCAGTVVYRSTSQFVTSGLAFQSHIVTDFSYIGQSFPALYLSGGYSVDGVAYQVSEVHEFAPPWYTVADVSVWFPEASQSPYTVIFDLYYSLYPLSVPFGTPTPTPTPAYGDYCGTVRGGDDDASAWFALPGLVLYPEGDCLQLGGFDILGYQVPGLRVCFQAFEIVDPVFLGVRIPLQLALTLFVFMSLLRRL